MEDSGYTIGQRIRDARVSAGLSQDQLASRVGVHQRDISSIETGPGLPSPQMLEQLAKALQTTTQELDGFREEDSLFLSKTLPLVREELQLGIEQAAQLLNMNPNDFFALENGSASPPVKSDLYSLAQRRDYEALLMFFATAKDRLSRGHQIDQGSADSRTPESEQSVTSPENQSENQQPERAPDDANPATDPDIRHGQNSFVARQATREDACLNVPAYAHALATFLRSVRGELCFGVFGPWGRGKTYLMDFVGEELLKHGYSKIEFSAWRFRRTPELWIHLYEVIAERARSKGTLVSLGLAVRVGIVRHGYQSLVAATLSLGFALFPGLLYFHWAMALLNLVGVVGLIICLKGYWGTLSFIRTLKQRYMEIASHDDKLGIQGLIGRDLVALFQGLMPREPERHQFMISSVATLVLPFVSLGIMLYFLISERMPGSRPIESFDWQLVAACGIWCAVVSAVNALTWMTIPRIKKTLLIVDDLDRCDGEEALQIIESIKVMLEERALQDRLQVVMLVEEDILKRAITRKYATLFGVVGDDDAAMRQMARTVREHIEKLFLCYFRMPRISPTDVDQLLSSFLSEQTRREANERARKSLQNRDALKRKAPIPIVRVAGAVPGKGPLVTSEASFLEARHQHEAAVQQTEKEVAQRRAEAEALAIPNEFVLLEATDDAVYCDSESLVLHEVLQNHFGAADCDNPSPRSIRCWLFKYQLARLLLRVQNQKPDPRLLAESLMTAYRADDATPTNTNPALDAVKRVALTVA